MKKQRAFNDSTKTADPLPEYDLRLFVTGANPNSTREITNILNICELNLKGRYELKIFDVYQDVELSRQQQIISLPLLIKKTNLQERKLIVD